MILHPRSGFLPTIGPVRDHSYDFACWMRLRIFEPLRGSNKTFRRYQRLFESEIDKGALLHYIAFYVTSHERRNYAQAVSCCLFTLRVRLCGHGTRQSRFSMELRQSHCWTQHRRGRSAWRLPGTPLKKVLITGNAESRIRVSARCLPIGLRGTRRNFMTQDTPHNY